MSLRLVPLGGLGEIGMNCLAIEAGNDGPIVVVDCGVKFPGVENGVDVLHPDFTWLEERAERVVALLVTHGHEDHIGAIPYLLRRVALPIYAPPYALGLVTERLKEHPAITDVRTFPTRPRGTFTVGRGAHFVEVEPIRVTHSIADATALAIRTEEGTILHTGDFKIDPDPIDGEQFDEERLRAIGDAGVEVLLSDSTNSDSPGRSRSEREVAATLARLIEPARKMVVVGLFASNVHRLRVLSEIARATSRRLVFLGRGVQTHARVAQETGYLKISPEYLATIDEAAGVPRERLLVVATGSQAEARSAMGRLALDDHPRLRVEEGDTVILSSRAIPGNEVLVMRMIGDFHRRGCVVHVASTEPSVHTTGHAHRDEQRAMIDLVRPTAFVPVHGTRHHLERHAQLAREIGVHDVLVVENGEIVRFHDAGLAKDGVTRVGKIAVDAGGEIPESILRERLLLGELGVAIVTVVVDAGGRSRATPKVATRGLLDETLRWEALVEAQREVAEALDTHPWTVERPTDQEVGEVARLAVRRALGRHVGHKPLALAHVVRAATAT